GAQKLISDFGTLEGIYENINKISSVSLREKLTKDQENAFLSNKLVTFVRDVPMDLSVEKLTRKPVDAPKLRDFLRELNFKAFEKTLLGDENSPVLATPIAKIEETKSSASSIPQDEAVVTTVANAPAEETELSIADAEKLISLQSEIWGVASDTGVYICYAEKLYRLTGSRSDWGQIFSAKKLNWKGHDLKGFWHELKIGEGEILWDSMLAAYIVRAGGEVGFAEVYNKYTGSVLPALASGSQLIQAAFNLEAVLKQKLNEVSGTKVLKEMELPLIPILYRMEEKGVRIDTQILSEQSEGLSKDIKKIEKEIFELAEETFNIGSPKQLGVVLFEKLKLPVGKKTKTGYSTDTDVLSGLAEAHPIANKIIEFRELSKLKSTYVDALPLMINAETKRIHTTFNQAHTATGRLSSINPNLQNIPIRTERGNAVRKAFVADEGNLLVSVDYSQIELRVLAHITQDPGLCRAFEDDLDIHTATAAEIFSVPLKEVTSDLRRKAKAVNFGIAYGQGAFGLAEALGISRSESAEIIKNYFRKFSNVSRFMDETIEKAKETGYVETLFGRRRYLDELKSKSPMIRKFGERAAINAPIQGTASDLVKMAMIQLEGKTELDLLLQVHDELIFEGPNKIIPAELEKICKIMETVTKLRVPLKVNGSSGISWAEAH
ncbi:MAG: DNA polymerase I, partial [Pseudobdellovibrionaceae bacterium]